MKISIVGAGRSGTSFATALADAGHDVRVIHHDELELVGDAEVVVLCVPDDAIAEISDALEPSDARVVVHVAGSRGLRDVARHPRAGSCTRSWSRPRERVGPQRLRGATFSVGGDRRRRRNSWPPRRVGLLRPAATISASTITRPRASRPITSWPHGHVGDSGRRGGSVTSRTFVPLVEQALGRRPGAWEPTRAH